MNAWQSLPFPIHVTTIFIYSVTFKLKHGLYISKNKLKLNGFLSIDFAHSHNYSNFVSFYGVNP